MALLDISANLTDRQKVIAEYWNDGLGTETPAGHWCRIAQFVSFRNHHDLDADVKMFFRINECNVRRQHCHVGRETSV